MTFDLDAANNWPKPSTRSAATSPLNVFFSGECFGFTPPYGAGQRRAAFDRFSM